MEKATVRGGNPGDFLLWENIKGVVFFYSDEVDKGKFYRLFDVDGKPAFDRMFGITRMVLEKDESVEEIVLAAESQGLVPRKVVSSTFHYPLREFRTTEKGATP